MMSDLPIRHTIATAVALLLTASLSRSDPPTTVSDLWSLQTAINRAGTGNVIVLTDGTYRTVGPIEVRGKCGTADKPIVIRATHRGAATISGKAGFALFDCEHVVIEGLRFTHDADQPAVLLEDCRRCRVTRNHFALAERDEPRRWEHWVYVIGARSGYNRFDRNLFENKRNRGSPLFVRGDDQTRTCSKHDRLDHNHFRNVPFANGENGHETVRTGSNVLGDFDCSSFTVIEDNLFEQCSGEPEIISLKSSHNIVRRNTFLNCYGGLFCRLGNSNTIENNVFVCTDDSEGRGGVSLYGQGHRVTGNYFLGLTGNSMRAPLAVKPGTFDGKIAPLRDQNAGDRTCAAAAHNVISGNTWVNCNALEFGLANQEQYRPFQPHHNRFAENIVIGGMSCKPLVKLHAPSATVFIDNVAWSEDPKRLRGAWSSRFRITDPTKLTQDDLSRWPSEPRPLTPDKVGPDAP